MRAKVSEERFLELCEEHGSAAKVARAIGTDASNVRARRQYLEKKHGKVIDLDSRNNDFNWRAYGKAYPIKLSYELKDGIVLVGSDIHIWPGYESTAQRAFIQFCKNLKPNVVVLNGDIFDFAGISRHHRIGWSHHPTPMEELDAALPWIQDVETAAPGAKLYRTPGNHCLRLEGFVSNKVPELEGLPGSKLRYYLPKWDSAWAIDINNDLWITHRFKGGVHAPHNNTKDAGRNFCTGHLHNQKVSPWTDLNGTRWGVDCGTMAEVGHEADWPQFEYLEGRSVDWRSGFAVFTYKDGKLLPPELATVTKKDHICFRGIEWRV